MLVETEFKLKKLKMQAEQNMNLRRVTEQKNYALISPSVKN
jgi:hypothetical protein